MHEFRHAPHPVSVSGLTAVSVEVLSVSAVMAFDVATQSATCAATMHFRVGPWDGNPMFDLRQTIQSASLDGVAIDPSQLAHHDMGAGWNAKMRVLGTTLAAGTEHDLAVNYPVGKPDAPSAQSLQWKTGGRFHFDIFLGDLYAGRYLEMWLPSNLLFDEFAVTWEIQLVGTTVPHNLLTNGTVEDLGSNWWRLTFPANFGPCSPMIVIRPSDELVWLESTVTLPSGAPITLTLVRPASEGGIDLAAQAVAIGGCLSDFETKVGTYLHGSGFKAFLSNTLTRSMEYAGATTSTTGSADHEAFHSWWARGVRPATGDDGWLDEGWTSWMIDAGQISTPLNMNAAPVTLWFGNPFIRNTPSIAYGSGSSFFAGLADLLGKSTLISVMSDIYGDTSQFRYTTPEIEAELIRRTGNLQIADGFDRFVYGYGDVSPGGAADLYMRDSETDNGSGYYGGGDFWLSPDLWIRVTEDDATDHQQPEHGQDNWLHARVHNRGGATCRSFVVGFAFKQWAGTEFVYPGDFGPLVGCAVGFNIEPGTSQVVKARWRREDVPASGTHGCLLAFVYDPDDPIGSGHHVWERNKLAQRNCTVVDLLPDESFEMVFSLGSRWREAAIMGTVEVLRSIPGVSVSIAHQDAALLRAILHGPVARPATGNATVGGVEPAIEIVSPEIVKLTARGNAGLVSIAPTPGSMVTIAEAGSGVRAATRAMLSKPRFRRDPRGGAVCELPARERVALPLMLRARRRTALTLRVRPPVGARPGQRFTISLVQRDGANGVSGGFTVIVNVVGKGRKT